METIKKDYYKIEPFEKGKMYTKGIYIGRWDGWSCDSHSFMFDCNEERVLIHPQDNEEIEKIKLLTC